MSDNIIKSFRSFRPTPESLPPRHVSYRLLVAPSLPVHITPLNPISFLLRAALIHPDKLALASPDGKHPVFYSFAVWAQRVQNLAYALISRGIRPGDRVAVIAPNCCMISDAMQGVLAARAVVTPINYRLTKSEISYILKHSGAKLILVDHEFLSLLDAAPDIPVIVSHDSGQSWDPYDKFLAEGREYSKERGWGGLEMESDEDANASLCYTSGTTGNPKGVISTLRGSYLAAIANAYETKLDLDSVYLWILPQFHACGWTYPWANVFAFSTQINIRSVNYPQIWNHFIHSGITHYCGAPTVQIGLINAPEPKKLKRRVISIIAGAAPTAHLISELEKLGIGVTHVYGLTETYGPFTKSYPRPTWATLSPEDRSSLIARQGHGFATADEARVVYQQEEGKTGDARDVPFDGKTLGEIVVRGNIVMKELRVLLAITLIKIARLMGLAKYFKNPDATQKAFEGGYFRTGDLAVRYQDGSVGISDRSKDLIISGGENASSLAIEQELSKHPAIQEVAVISHPHQFWGERPLALAILHPSSHRKYQHQRGEGKFETELKDWVKKEGRLSGFAIPEWVRIVEELPKTATGKIMKNVLREKWKSRKLESAIPSEGEKAKL